MRSFSLTLLAKLALDLLLGAAAASILAFALRLEWQITSYQSSIWFFTLASVAVLASVEIFFKLPWRSWRASSIRDLSHLFKAVISYGLILSAILFLFGGSLRVPRSVPFITTILAFLFMGGMRFAFRTYSEKNCPRTRREDGPKRVLIIGAGEAGIMIAREMLRHPESWLEPVAFLDDDLTKKNTVISGIPVCGKIEDLSLIHI